MTINPQRWFAVVLGTFGALLWVLTFVYAWQDGGLGLVAVFTVAGAIVAFLIIKNYLPKR